jgi:hypothetical protein
MFRRVPKLPCGAATKVENEKGFCDRLVVVTMKCGDLRNARLVGGGLLGLIYSGYE